MIKNKPIDELISESNGKYIKLYGAYVYDDPEMRMFAFIDNLNGESIHSSIGNDYLRRRIFTSFEKLVSFYKENICRVSFSDGEDRSNWYSSAFILSIEEKTIIQDIWNNYKELIN